MPFRTLIYELSLMERLELHTHTKTEGLLGPEVFVFVTQAEPIDLIHFIAHISKHDITILV